MDVLEMDPPRAESASVLLEDGAYLVVELEPGGTDFYLRRLAGWPEAELDRPATSLVTGRATPLRAHARHR